ncbi:FIST N-terminal domain-containing protein [Variovorax sp. PCZ-1]|uniref:FIST signal transduction protein n=1 Tax=Variovorax sp. PCZ-1 TaxID=2835533 RepID=UPI001BCDF221|nr:FIST N-terminal domain-containing protein [Variovorax sp. PCZ-1]MBS7806532.1 FIST C-terminal domain-containing protein [Variovorax sp. PCZ-1]
MKPFTYAHATHPQWRMAAGLVVAQLRAQMALPAHADQPNLGLVYLTDHYADQAQDLLNHLRQELPQISDWVGTVGVGIAATNVEYFDEPALAVMLFDLPREQYRVFSGVAPLITSASFKPHSALVHADGHTPDLAELLGELSGRTASGYLFGGLAASRHSAPQIALHEGSEHAGVFAGALSGVAFSESVGIVSRVTQGCQPIRLEDGKAAKPHRITKSDKHVVLELDGEPALDVLLDELGISLSEPQRAVERLKQTFVGLTASEPHDQSLARSQGRFGPDTRVRHLVGLDPLRRGIAVADIAPEGSELTFCERNREAARRDLMRICAEIREELEVSEFINATDSIALSADSMPSNEQYRSKNIVGAIYVSCAGRGGPHFGGDSAELQIVRHALGDVPLVGFFAGGEIAHQNLYGYTGVLTVFTALA